VVLDARKPLPGLADSKQLTAAQRERLVPLVHDAAIAWAIAQASPDEIRASNILRASLLAMLRAFAGLGWSGQRLEIIADGNFYPPGLPPGRAVVRGDALIPAISAASILAKVHRDRLMCELAKEHPQFSFSRHKGYPTPQHLRELSEHGPLPLLHRENFAPVRHCLQARLLP
ncbi:MAG: hypothetical protein A2Y63_00805, partial [Candidatus Riflebacteria bacterium RBG_13_59_9]